MRVIIAGCTTFFCGAVIIAFAFYLDHLRRLDPNFKRKIKERRKKLETQHLSPKEIVPVPIDARCREAIIISEIQLAEKMMAAKNKDEEAIVHFANAISVCSDPGHLLNCLRTTLPPSYYGMLIDLLINTFGDNVDVEYFRRNSEEIKTKAVHF